MKVFSFFSGMDNFGLGFRNQGHEQVGHAEIDYSSNLLNEEANPELKGKNYGCIRKIAADPGILPYFDCAIGGAPCPAFSQAGKRTENPFDQVEVGGDLFLHFSKILEFHQPRILVLEQVKGVLSSGRYKGEIFGFMLNRLSELGYDCQWQTLNSKNFGVPQNRERVFIVGHLRGTTRPEVFPIVGEANSYTCKSESAKTAVARTISGGGHSGGNHSGMTILQLNKPKHSNDRIYSDKGISPTLNTCSGGNRQPFIKNGKVLRRLTPLEFFRLQGTPDRVFLKGKELGISDTQLFKMAGNSVTVPVIEAIASRIK